MPFMEKNLEKIKMNKNNLKEIIAALYAYHRIAAGANEHSENEFPYKCQICSLINRTEALL